MDAEPTVDVVRIPQDGRSVEIVTLLWMTVASFTTSASSQHEEHVTRGLDVCDSVYGLSYELTSHYGMLVDLGNMDPQQNPHDRYFQRGPFYMYKISDGARRHIPHALNKHFERAKAASDVYGHVHIYKAKQQGSGNERMTVEYENLDKSFINTAFEGKGLSASESLKWLSQQ